MSSTHVLAPTADSLARLYTAEAMGTLVQAARGDIPGIKAGERIRAAEALLDRGHGRAVQAVISVPARQAVSAKLAAMSEDALLAIALRARGVGSKTGDPLGPMQQAGSHQERGDGVSEGGPNVTGTCPEPRAMGGNPEPSTGIREPSTDIFAPRAGVPKPSNGALVPTRFKHADVVDGEFDDVDPLG